MHAPADSQHDVVVVGARCAGAVTAMLLGRLGHGVTLVERAPIPSDTLSTHGIARGGVVQLAKWGLLDRVLASGAPAIRQVVFQADGVEDVRTVKPRDGVDLLVAPRRYVLDGILVDAAIAAGATIRAGLTATGLIRAGDGRVQGIRARRADGTVACLPAKIVVGADGVRSRMATLFGSAVRESHPTDNATFYAYISGPSWRGFEFHVGEFADGRPAPASFPPTIARPACGSAVPASSRWPARRRGGAVPEPLGSVSPTLAARMGAGRVVSPVRGAVDCPTTSASATGPGWALVGDAGYHRDPITGHGITDAFRDAELLPTRASTTAYAAAPPTCRSTRPPATPPCGRRSTHLRDDVLPAARRVRRAAERLARALELEADFLASRAPPTGGRREAASVERRT